MPPGNTSKTLRRLVWLAGCTVIVLLALLPVLGNALIGSHEADWMIFFGRFHIVLLHVPIGVFIWVATMEAGRLVTRGRWNPDVLWALGFGALTAAGTALLGYLLLRDAGTTELLTKHMWTGLAFASLAMLTFLLKFSDREKPYLLCLAASLGMMTLSAHFGASSVHGSEYLTKYAPAWLQKILGEPVKKQAPTPVGEKADTVFLHAIEPILRAKCSSCHNADKAKGGLDVTTFATLAKGGDAGPAIVPGKPEESLLIQRISLPLTDDDHMPPPSKPQLTPGEIALLKWWIASGASPDQLFQDAAIPADLLPSLNAPTPPPAASPTPADTALRDQLVPAVAQLNQDFPSAVNFAGQDSADILVSTAALRPAFSDADLAKLSPISAAIVDLDLGGSAITDAGMPTVAQMKRLTRLRLENTEVTDTGVAALKSLPALESLSLYGCAVTDAALKDLAELPTLKRLYLGATQVTPAALTALQQKSPALEIIMPPDAKDFPMVATKPTAAAPTEAANETPTHFTKVILPVLRQHCAVCHNATRLSGDLDVTTYRTLITAGDGVTENVITPNDPEESLMIKRIKLPLDAKQHMPPKRRPQMKPEEIELLTKWVADGAREN